MGLLDPTEGVAGNDALAWSGGLENDIGACMPPPNEGALARGGAGKADELNDDVEGAMGRAPRLSLDVAELSEGGLASAVAGRAAELALLVLGRSLVLSPGVDDRLAPSPFATDGGANRLDELSAKSHGSAATEAAPAVVAAPAPPRTSASKSTTAPDASTPGGLRFAPPTLALSSSRRISAR